MTSQIYRNSVRKNNSSIVLENSNNSVNINSIDGYAILGHGNNGIETTIVPKGSIVIAKAHPGDDKVGLETELLKEKQKILNIQYIQTTLNPLKNMRNLYGLFGSVSIFTGGQTCPNFYYSLIAIHPRPNGKMRIGVSGIIKIPVSDLNLLEMAYMFDENMTIRKYKSNPIKIGSLFRLCDNSILKLDTIDHSKKKILTDKIDLYKNILSHFDEYKSEIIKDNDDDLLVLIGIREKNESVMHMRGMHTENLYSRYESVKDEIKRALKANFNSRSKSERNFYRNTYNSKISLDTYIDGFKDAIPDIIRSLEADIENLNNRTIEEYIDDYISNSDDNDKLIGIIRELKEKLYITQSSIFENSLKPSITYNFVCRVNENSEKWYNSNNNIHRNGILNNQRKYFSYGRNANNTRNINQRIRNRNTKKLGLTRSVTNQISEAELQRKRQIKNASNLLYR